MAKLADLGFRFSIDKVTDLDLDFQDLARADVAFVKIAAPLLLDELQDDGRPPDAALVPRPGGRRLRRSSPAATASSWSPRRSRASARWSTSSISTSGSARATCSASRAPIRDAVLAESVPPADVIQAALRRRAG